MGHELEGRVAVVTGGASGIGRATVDVFVREGARVVVADVDAAAGAAIQTDAIAFKETDVADPDAVQALVDYTVERFGRLDVMFNNAGISSAMTGLLKDELTDFTRVMNVNVLGVIVGTQRAARHMAVNGGGVVINNSSIAGLNPGPGLVTYRLSKAAVIHFSKSAAIELAPHGIRVNCVAPAHIATAITHYDMTPVIESMQPLQRRGQPSDVAEAVLYLASNRAAQVTGVVLPVDGGTSAGPPRNAIEKARTR